MASLPTIAAPAAQVPLILRHFSDELEAIAKLWRAVCVSDEPWIEIQGLIPSRGQNGFLATNGTVNGWCKPMQPAALATHPNAAHEKIAADLGLELSLPVPPAILARNFFGTKGQATCAAVSCIPFWPAYKWETVKGTQIVRNAADRINTIASAMVPFDAWIANQDRVGNEGNLVLRAGDGNQGLGLRVTYIDFANTMALSWTSAQAAKQISVQAVFPQLMQLGQQTPLPPDLNAIAIMLKKIEDVSDSVIDGIVSRIPVDFMTPAHRDTVRSALKDRRGCLRAELVKRYGGLS